MIASVGPPHRPHAARRRRRRQLLDADPRRRGGGRRSTARRARASSRARRARCAEHGAGCSGERDRSVRTGPAPARPRPPRGARARAAARAALARAGRRTSSASASRLHQQLREIRAGSRRRLRAERERTGTRALVLARKAGSTLARLPRAAPARARAARARARRPRPPAHARARLRAGAAHATGSRCPRRRRGAERGRAVGCASPTASRRRARSASGERRRAASRRARPAPERRSATRPAAARVEEIIRAWTPARRACDETLELVSEGKRLIEQCAGELAAVGDALEELRLDELVARLEAGGGRMSTWERARRAAGRDRRLLAGGPRGGVSSDFERKSTVIRLRGGGQEGIGEDVTYDAVDHDILQAAGPSLAARRDASRSRPSASTSPALELFPEPPQREVSAPLPHVGVRVGGARPRAAPGGAARCTRRSGASPSRCASSSRCASASRRRSSRCAERLELYPGLRFKLDPTSSWDRELIAELVATGAVDSVDFKGLYTGSIVDQPADPVLYGRVVDGVPGGLDRGSGADAGDRRGARPSPRPLLLGRADPLDRGHRGAALPAADGQHQALAARRPAQPARRLRLLRRARASATTAAASSSSAWAAGRTSTSPRCSTPTRPTTSRRRGFNLPVTPGRACRAARSRRRRAPTGFRWG